MAKAKKSPKSSRSAQRSKAKKAPGRVRLPVLDALMAPLTGKVKRGRKSPRVDETDALLAAAQVDTSKAEAPVGAAPLSGVKLARAKRAAKDRVLDLVAPVPAAPARLTRMISDPRLPAVGAEIVRTYKGKEYRVVRHDFWFTFEGRQYPSLSKIAREIIGGAQVNGFAFFGLVPKVEKATS